MLRRDFDLSRLGPVVSHPDVKPWVLLPEDVNSLLPLINNPANVLLMTDEGGIFFQQHESTIYEAHTQFLPTCRGTRALTVCRECLEWMFVKTPCMQLYTRLREDNIRGMGLIGSTGGRLEFVREATTDSPAVRFYGLPYAEWAKTVKGKFIELGQKFHSTLESEWLRVGLAGMIKDHPEDLSHDHAVGLCVAMLLSGNTEKAIILYNRWARLAGYPGVFIVDLQPLTLNIGDVIIQVAPRAEGLEVLKVLPGVLKEKPVMRVVA